MRDVTYLAAGALETRTGGSIYNRCVIDALRRAGWSIDVRELHGAFPDPDADTRERARQLVDSLPDGATVVVDGLAFSALPDEMENAARRVRLIALVHLPIAAAVGLPTHTAALFAARERRALSVAAHIVVTGAASIGMLGPYGIDRQRISVIVPGTERAPLAHGSGDGPLALLCVATVSHGKGHDTLLRALHALNSRASREERPVPGANAPPQNTTHRANTPAWHLHCVGSLTRDADAAAHAKVLTERLGLARDVTFHGDVHRDALERLYDRADIFVLATRQETYGMAVAEALAHGLPVIATSTGAIPELVGTTAGIVVPMDDVPALTAAMWTLMTDDAARARMANGARHVRDGLPTWDDAARQMATVIEQVNHDG